MSVEFVSYDGAYPCLCYGDLMLKIDNEEVVLHSPLTSGGAVWFDEDWEEHVEKGSWSVDVPDEYLIYEDEILDVVNENIPYGCCGGCI